MKFRSLFVVAAIAIFAACETPYRATDSGVVVTQQMQTNFETQYPGATRVVWSSYDPVAVYPLDMELSGWPAMDSTDYVVTFSLDNYDHYAWYDANGDLIGSAYVVTDQSTLPSAVTKTLNDRYPGYTISTVNRQTSKNRVAYEVELKQGDTRTKVLVDANDGTVIKEKSKSQ